MMDERMEKKHGKLKGMLIGAAVVGLLVVGGAVKVNVNFTSTSGTRTTSQDHLVYSQRAEQTADGNASVERAEQKTAGANVSKDLKAFLDEYEAFADEYGEFARTYDKSDFSASLKAMDMMNTALDYSVKVSKFDEGKMSTADRKYFEEVTDRVAGKVAKVTEEMQ